MIKGLGNFFEFLRNLYSYKLTYTVTGPTNQSECQDKVTQDLRVLLI